MKRTSCAIRGCQTRLIIRAAVPTDDVAGAALRLLGIAGGVLAARLVAAVLLFCGRLIVGLVLHELEQVAEGAHRLFALEHFLGDGD